MKDATKAGDKSDGALQEKLARWILFGVALAVLPLAFNYLSALTRNLPMSLEELCSKGEVLLVCAGIAGAGTGELIGMKGEGYRSHKIVAGGGAVIVLFLASLWYAILTDAAARGVPVDKVLVFHGSSVIFLATLLSSGSCVALAEIGK